MRYLLISFILFFCSFEAVCDPLNHNVQFPTLYMFLSPKPETAGIPDKLKISFSLDHTSIHIDKSSENFDVLMDMEYTVFTPAIEFSPFNSFSVFLMIPFVSMNDGFLDRPLADYHDAGNFPDYGRSTRPHNEFAYYIRKDGKDWFTAKKGSCYISDITLGAKKLLYIGDSSVLSLSFKVKLPTGDFRYGFGSGETDYGFFLLSESRISDFVFYLNAGFALIENPKTISADIETDNIYTLFAAIEYLYKEDLSFIVQFNSFTNHIKNSGINNFENNTVEGTIGLRKSISDRYNFEFSFSEDLTYRASAPDFTFQTGLTIKF